MRRGTAVYKIPAACSCFGLHKGTSGVPSPSLIPIFPGLPSHLLPVVIASVEVEEVFNVA